MVDHTYVFQNVGDPDYTNYAKITITAITSDPASITFQWGYQTDGTTDLSGGSSQTGTGGNTTPTTIPYVPTDMDGDGVIDDWDQCPSTPSGSLVDSTGCPGTNCTGTGQNSCCITVESDFSLDLPCVSYYGQQLQVTLVYDLFMGGWKVGSVVPQ
jgi:hypothetical protein